MSNTLDLPPGFLIQGNAMGQTLLLGFSTVLTGHKNLIEPFGLRSIGQVGNQLMHRILKSSEPGKGIGIDYQKTNAAAIKNVSSSGRTPTNEALSISHNKFIPNTLCPLAPPKGKIAPRCGS